MESDVFHEVVRGVPGMRMPLPGGLALAEKIVETSPDGIMVCDKAQRIVWVNTAFSEMTGLSSIDVVGATPRLLRSGLHDETFYRTMREGLASDGRWQGEIYNRHRDGRVIPAWASVNVVPGAPATGGHYYVARYYGLDDQRRLPGFLHHMAYFDSLTGLPNRNLFFDRLQQAIRQAGRSGTPLAVLFIDLDNFKSINDTLGHDCGDRLLKAVAKRLVKCVRDNDTLSRFGGDEFAAVLPDLVAGTAAVPVAKRIVQQFETPFSLDGHVVFSNASVGISVWPSDSKDAATLVKHADTAMYHVKKVRGCGYRFYAR